VLSQKNSRKQESIAKINLNIAQAVRSDSIPVRTIAYVTLVLLPGAFISSIFGMNFFTFDTQKRTLVVAKSSGSTGR
jgi:Mg2+ and Co2+ transporter CorA